MPVHVTCPTCGTPNVRPPSRAHRVHCSMRCAKLKPREPLRIDADGITALVPLRARDGSIRAHALIDAADAEWAAQWRWSLDSDGYAVRAEYAGPGKYLPLLRLHRELLGLTGDASVDVDHWDGDPLNNRRTNLRVLPKGGNAQNRKSNSGSSSRHRGVSWARNGWRVDVYANGKSHYLGCYASEEEAAEVARAARLIHMPFAVD